MSERDGPGAIGPEQDHDDAPQDQLADDVMGEDHQEIADALRALLGPSRDVRTRAVERVDRTLHGRSLMVTVTDLSRVGWETVRLLLTNPAATADRRPDGEAPMNGSDR